MPFSVAHERAAVALDVADVDQALDDRRARRRRADARLLHRLAQLVVVDELARGLHRAQQRRVGVAPRRLGLLLQRPRPRGCRPPRRARGAAAAGRAPSSSSPRALALGQLAVDAAPARRRAGPCRACGTRARRRSSPRACSRTPRRGGRRPGSGGRPGRRCGGRRRSSSRAWCSRVGRDDRVVVADLGVVDDARRAAAGPARGRSAAAFAYSRRRPTWPAVGLISPIMSLVR